MECRVFVGALSVVFAWCVDCCCPLGFVGVNVLPGLCWVVIFGADSCAWGYYEFNGWMLC